MSPLPGPYNPANRSSKDEGEGPEGDEGLAQGRYHSRPSRYGGDPRHYQPSTRITDRQLGAGLALDENGRVYVNFTGAISVNAETGEVLLNVGGGLVEAPGSPVALRLYLDDESVKLDADGRVIARPKASQVMNDSSVEGHNLAEAVETNAAALSDIRNQTTYTVSQLRDTNGCIALLITASGSAISGLEIVTSPTTSPVILRPTSIDADVDFWIFGRGAGLVYVNGSLPEPTRVRGLETLVAGAVTVSGATNVSAANPPLISRVTLGGTPGHLHITNIVDATSFDIESTDAADTSTVAWEIPQ